jgi:quinol-cytochrome oxidoreductase complex cytochrome b subunit
MSENREKSQYDKIVEWLDNRIGIAKTPLRPIPAFSLNPIYWLGLLMALCFAMQVATGMFQLLYYVPTSADAYSSTTYIIQSVPLGQLVETLHLYTAYAMILLAMLHLTRNYFGSAHKAPRELMWIVGWILFLITLSMGLTGYLLPWTVISKSATDVAIGFLNFFPAGISNILRFIVSGSGSDDDLLQHFFIIHTVILPWALALFLALKVYLFEVHGPSYIRAYGRGSSEIHPWFPKVFLYALMLFSVFIAFLVTLATFVPLTLPPMFTAQAASQYVVQPDWYLLWLYQILKLDVFEGAFAVVALALVSAFLVILVLLPFYDRSKRRDIVTRPIFTTIGAVIVTEFVVLTVWGYLTPGQVISNWDAIAVLGMPALIVILVTHLLFDRRKKTQISMDIAGEVRTNVATNMNKALMISKGYGPFTGFFVILLGVASVSIATLVNSLSSILSNMPIIALTLTLLISSLFFMLRMFGRIVMAYEEEHK